MNCQKCGNFNTEGVKFCVYCGNDMLPNQHQNIKGIQSNTPTPQNVNIPSENIVETNLQNNNIEPLGIPKVTINQNITNTQMQTATIGGNNQNINPQVTNIHPININQNVTNTQNLNTPIIDNNTKISQQTTNIQPTNINQNTISQSNNIMQNNQRIEIDNNPKNKMSKKILILIIGIILVIGIICLIIFLPKSSKSGNKIEVSDKFSSNQPIPIEQNGKYGYITSEGKELIKAKYNTLSEFNGKYAAISIDNPDTTSEKKTLYNIIDTNGNIKVYKEIYSQPIYYPEYQIWIIDNELYDSNINKISPNNVTVEYIGEGYLLWKDSTQNKKGLMNKKGEITYTQTFETEYHNYLNIVISKTNEMFEQSYCLVNIENEKYAIINCNTGKIIYDFTEKHIYGEKNNIYRIEEVGSVYIQNDKILYQTSSYMELDYDGYIKIEETPTKYIEIETGKILTEKPKIDIDYDEILKEQTYGYRIEKGSDGYGIMSKNKVIIEQKYDNIEFLNSSLHDYLKNKYGKELILAEESDKTNLINIKNKKIITTFESTNVTDYENSSFIKIEIKKDNVKSYMIYNLLTDKSKIFTQDEKISIYSNYITTKKDNKIIYYNTELTKIYEEEVQDE